MWLNIDLGERADEDPQLFSYAHIANIACGGHAGDAASMRASLRRCLAAGTVVSAHPSYVDRAHFGRRPLAVPTAVLRDQLAEQLRGLVAQAAAVGLAVRIIKPHGALYHAAQARSDVAEVLIDAAYDALGSSVAFIGPGDGAMRAQTQARGGAYLVEGFADRGRRRRPQGGWELIPRGEPGAVLADAAAVVAQAKELRAEGGIDTLCLHGDHPRATECARRLRARLDALGVGPWPRSVNAAASPGRHRAT